MNFNSFFKKFLIFTLKEIYSFFLKSSLFLITLFIFLFIIFTSISNIINNEDNKNYSYVVINSKQVTNDKLENSLFKDKKFNISFRDLTSSLERISNDNKVKGVFIDLDNIELSASNIEELTTKFEMIKKKNKKIYAYGTSIDNHTYSIALLADEIIVVPSESANISLTGYNYSNIYMKDLFDKIGLEFEVLHIGDYKTFGENYSSNKMSEALKSEITRIYDKRYEYSTNKIANSRKIDLANLQKNILDGKLAFISPFTARDFNLIDKLEYLNDTFTRLNIEAKDTVDIYSYIDINRNKMTNKHKAKDKIAIIYAEGPIANLNEQQTEISITIDGIEQKLSQLKDINNLKGVVVRVNSPGGSALASEIIYNELKKLDVPVYISMGDVAASGGYYISMAGDKIFANKATITGSIGVVSIVPKINKASKKIGINNDTISKGKFSNIYDPFTPLDDESRNKIISSMTGTYSEFKSRVTSNRKISDVDLEKLAQGRIWLGEEAVENHLVDKIGTLDDTINTLAKDLNLKSYEVVDIYSKENLSQIISRFLNLNSSASTLIKFAKIMDDEKFIKNNYITPLYYLETKLNIN